MKIPKLIAELDRITNMRNKACDVNKKKTRREQIVELQNSLDDKLNVLEEQENEKVELMMEWLNHRLHDVAQFSDNTTQLLSLKSRIMELKSKYV